MDVKGVIDPQSTAEIGWYLYWQDSAVREWHWWHLFTSHRPREFGHVSCFGMVGGQWLYVTANPNEVIVGVIEPDILSELVQQPGARVVFVPKAEDAHSTPWRLRSVLTCVELVKGLVGCKSIRVATPYQLYEWSVKHGRIIRWRPERGRTEGEEKAGRSSGARRSAESQAHGASQE